MAENLLTYLKGLAENVPTSHIQHDLTDREGAHTRCHCTQGEVLGQYYSREAHKTYLWPCDMAINEHQLAETERAASMRLYRAGAHALSALLYRIRRLFTLTANSLGPALGAMGK